jgi:hypothetical protein
VALHPLNDPLSWVPSIDDHGPFGRIQPDSTLALHFDVVTAMLQPIRFYRLFYDSSISTLLPQKLHGRVKKLKFAETHWLLINAFCQMDGRAYV